MNTFQNMMLEVRAGDVLYMWNTHVISHVIEEVTEIKVQGVEEEGPSHVIMICDLQPYSKEWFELEAVFMYGTRLLPLSHYAKSSSKMVLTRRKGVTSEDITKATGAFLECLGRQYEVKEEVEIVCNKIAPWVKIEKTDNRLFCSGAVHHAWKGTSVPFAVPVSGNATPMFLYQDAGNEIVIQVN